MEGYQALNRRTCVSSLKRFCGKSLLLPESPYFVALRRGLLHPSPGTARAWHSALILSYIPDGHKRLNLPARRNLSTGI